jgi:hypothetical protein
VHFEQSQCFQRYAIDVYLHFLLLASRKAIEVPPQVGTEFSGCWSSSSRFRCPTAPSVDWRFRWRQPPAARTPLDR